MDELATDSNRKRWRRLGIGVISISCVLSGAVYDAIHSHATEADLRPVRTERVWFAPAEAGQPGG
jgi:hypothetical protein